MFDEFFMTAHELVRAGRPFATAVVVRAEKPTSAKPGDRAIITLDGTMTGWIGGSCAQPTVIREAIRAIREDHSRLVRLSPEPGTATVPEGISEVPMTCFSGGTLDIFIEPHHPRPRLLLVGALPVAQALAHLGRALNYDVVAVDPTGSEAMAHADRTVRALDEIPAHITPLTFIVVATHGEFDEPALVHALETEAPYIGLVASRRRGESVLASLAREGVAADALARIRFPAGLDILARRGDEIALGIMAEIVKTRRSMEQLEWPAPDDADTAARDAVAAADEAGRPGADAPSSESTAEAGGLRVLSGAPAILGQANATASAIDPVCGMSVQVESALHTWDLDGNRYYFCCDGCRTRFVANPGRYLDSPS